MLRRINPREKERDRGGKGETFLKLKFKKNRNHKNGVFLADGWLLRRIMLHMEHKFSLIPKQFNLENFLTEIKLPCSSLLLE